MSGERVKDTHCQMCRKQLRIMKRCTRCKTVVYCSRDCQITDWPSHQQQCGQTQSSSDCRDVNRSAKISYRENDNSIFDGLETKQHSDITHPPLVDFSKAAMKTNLTVKPDAKCYLHNNIYLTDVPEISDDSQKWTITIKCNKEKQKLCVQKTWTGVEVYKFLAFSLNVPLNKLKIIHKGKVLDKDSITATLADKALYQVIGEQAENEDGLDQRDIAVMMEQMGVDRNVAVKTLRDKGDLIDALLG